MSDVEIIVKAIDLASPNIKIIDSNFQLLRRGVGITDKQFDQLKKGVGDFASRVQSNLSGAKEAWQKFATPIRDTIEILEKVGRAAQQAYQFISEGTQLARAQDQFDALASSIGTTSTALLSQLKTATRGTVSDFGLMSGASSLVSLGLTKTSEDTVRLTKLIGQLGWDMNQVTLTLANQSTMRLDALGLSVTDVQGRAKALQEQGYATDEAFKFAIIEAGEAKLNMLGDAADTAAGKLSILEANAANLKDSFQATFSQEMIGLINEFAGGLFESADGASEFGEKFAKGVVSYFRHDPIGDAVDAAKELKGEFARLNPVMDKTAGITPKLNAAFMAQRDAIIADTAAIDGWAASMNTVTTMTPQAIRQLHQNAAAIYNETSPAYAELQDKIYQTNSTYDTNIQTIRAANLANQQLADTVPEVTGGIYASAEAVGAYNSHLGELYMQAHNTDSANMLLNSGIRETAGGLVQVSNLTEEQTEDMKRMQAAYDKAAQTIRDYELGVKGANLTDEERNKKIEEQQGIMATLAGNIDQLSAAGYHYVEVAGQMVSFGPAVASAFMDSASAMGANAEQLAAIQLAFSDMSDEQAESILKEAALRAEVELLTQEILNGNMSVYEARDAYIAFQDSLDNSNILVNDTTGSVILMNDAMGSASGAVGSLQMSLDEFNTDNAIGATQAFIDRLNSIPSSIVVDMTINETGGTAYGHGGYQDPNASNQYNPAASGGGIPNGTGGSGSSRGGVQQYASGGSFIVPPGYPPSRPGMMIGVHSGEEVNISRPGESIGGNVTNNYNLYVTATDGGENITREFNYMKALAGAMQ